MLTSACGRKRPFLLAIFGVYERPLSGKADIGSILRNHATSVRTKEHTKLDVEPESPNLLHCVARGTTGCQLLINLSLVQDRVAEPNMKKPAN